VEPAEQLDVGANVNGAVFQNFLRLLPVPLSRGKAEVKVNDMRRRRNAGVKVTE